MRTEALVALFVAAAAACLVTVARGRVRSACGLGAAIVAGAVVPVAASQLLERVVIGSDVRGGRAASTAAAAGSAGADRASEALITFVGLNRFVTPNDWVIGAVIACCVAVGAWWSVRGASRLRGAVALGLGAFLYLVLLADGLGFVPGVLTASPLAAAGIALLWTSPRFRLVGTLALVTLVIVWVAQYTGNARAQWGARYALLPGLLLAVVAVVALARRPRALVAVVALSGLVTLSGVAWLGDRSHTIADGMTALIARDDDAVVSLGGHLLREGGAFYRPDRHWLTATDRAELRRALAAVDAAGDAEVAVLTGASDRLPAAIGAYRRVGAVPFELRPGEALQVVEYHRA
jgi:hypothetical protein